MQTYISQILDELRNALIPVSNDQGEKLAHAITNSRAVFVAGAGRSGLAMKSFAMRLMHLGFETYVVGETLTPNITDRDVLLVGSGSGSTGSLVGIADKARAVGAAICLITIQEDSPVGQMADTILTIPAPTPKIDVDLNLASVQPMGSLFEQSLLLTLDAIILLLMDKTGKDTDAMFARHANLE
ncbi:MAG: 6-phospho-3-hexuloisomerase [Candidatus Poribacteria bacterium]|nr:6-phospho-3-hexuloisomerase [Candidatus Poribacteria bacterium]